ncbi:hypothetical protein GF360_03885 [candidate division WWE3 bacterium]|nr:hypothetical protein [candidate division WWE3 bacterium]
MTQKSNSKSPTQILKGTILIHGGSAASREKGITKILKNAQVDTSQIKNNPDIKILKNKKGKKSIGIGQVRQAIKFLSQKPYMSRRKFVIVKNAHFLTRQAQNSFLKTLEEPPQYATLILETANKKELLDTILSRCQQIKIAPAAREVEQAQALPKIKRLSLGKKMELAEKLAKKSHTEVASLLERWIESERALLRESSQEDVIKNLKVLEQVRQDLTSTNVNLQLALEFLLLKLK